MDKKKHIETKSIIEDIANNVILYGNNTIINGMYLTGSLNIGLAGNILENVELLNINSANQIIITNSIDCNFSNIICLNDITINIDLLNPVNNIVMSNLNSI